MKYFYIEAQKSRKEAARAGVYQNEIKQRGMIYFDKFGIKSHEVVPGLLIRRLFSLDVPLAIIDHLLQNLARHVGQPDVIVVAILDCELNYLRLEGHRFVDLKDNVVGGLQDHLPRCRRHVSLFAL